MIRNEAREMIVADDLQQITRWSRNLPRLQRRPFEQAVRDPSQCAEQP